VTGDLLCVFPEPLPLPQARGIQVIHNAVSLAEAGVRVILAYVPAYAGADTSELFSHYGLRQPDGLKLWPLSRSLPWPLSLIKFRSRRLFLWRLRRQIQTARRQGEAPVLIFARHVKLAADMLQDDGFWPPMVYEAHEVFADGAPSSGFARLARQEQVVLHKSAALVAISRQLAQALQKRYCLQRPFEIIPSAATLHTGTPQKDWYQAHNRIVYAGNFYEWKGVEDLLAAARLLPSYYQIHLIGALPAHMRPQIDNTTGAHVVIHGVLPHQQTLAFLLDACIAVLPNRAQSVSAYTSPLKLFEYMATGCAVVASDLPVLREILRDEDAAWFSPGDAKSLATAITGLVDNQGRSREMGERLARQVKNYSWEARAVRLQACFQKTLAIPANA